VQSVGSDTPMNKQQKTMWSGNNDTAHLADMVLQGAFVCVHFCVVCVCAACVCVCIFALCVCVCVCCVRVCACVLRVSCVCMCVCVCLCLVCCCVCVCVYVYVCVCAMYACLRRGIMYVCMYISMCVYMRVVEGGEVKLSIIIIIGPWFVCSTCRQI